VSAINQTRHKSDLTSYYSGSYIESMLMSQHAESRQAERDSIGLNFRGEGYLQTHDIAETLGQQSGSNSFSSGMRK
jgi:hypothetical protein